METEDIKKNDEAENALSHIPKEISGQKENILYIDENSSGKKKTHGDDVILTQCILCLILALAVFLLKFISEDFQHDLLSVYTEKTNAPAEPFIVQITEAIEAWFKR
ncbi:MAG: hypothetical protein K2H01_02775 [Ruminococcus sp.]|nr:hypothetical protein [Ruminococcus sp.]